MSHPVLRRLRDPDPDVRRAACRDAVGDPSAVLLLDALGDALGDPVRDVARAASDALAELGRRTPDVGPVLRRALRSDDPARRFGAASTSARIAPPNATLIPALVEALGADVGDVRWSAARILVDLGRLSREVFPILFGLVRAGPDPRARRMAIFCLRELAPDVPETANALLAASRAPDAELRCAALTALGALCDPPAVVAQRLNEARARDTDAACRRAADAALQISRPERPQPSD